MACPFLKTNIPFATKCIKVDMCNITGHKIQKAEKSMFCNTENTWKYCSIFARNKDAKISRVEQVVNEVLEISKIPHESLKEDKGFIVSIEDEVKKAKRKEDIKQFSEILKNGIIQFLKFSWGGIKIFLKFSCQGLKVLFKELEESNKRQQKEAKKETKRQRKIAKRNKNKNKG